MKFYVIRYKQEVPVAGDFADVFTKKAEAKAELDENFNAYGKLGADLVEMNSEELTELTSSEVVVTFN